MAIDVIMPALGMAQDTGRLVSWLMSIGDAVNEADILMEVETDKTTMEVPAGANGFISEFLAEPGDDVPVGNVIAIITSNKEDIKGVGSATAEYEQTVNNGENVNSNLEIEISKSETMLPDLSIKNNLKVNQNDLNLSEEPKAIGKILASPKLKMFANDAGYDLSLLQKNGIEEPYNVSDIEALKHLTKINNKNGAHPYVPAKSQIQAKVPALPIDDFTDRISIELGDDISPKSLWLSFISSSFLDVFDITNFKVNINNELGIFTDAYENPHSSRLANQLPLDEFENPDLIIHNLTRTYVSNLNINFVSIPELCIHRAQNTYELSFVFNDMKFDNEDALIFIDKLSQKIANPLLGLI
ncbi:hypothetical protein N9V66_01355 [Amylibacter sp.]|nr:hypothetical protein [Amylibacter sp.]